MGKLRTAIPLARRLAAQTVRAEREAAGLTQEQLALRYGVGVRTLRDIEAGKARMTALELVISLRLAAAGPSSSEVLHEVVTPALNANGAHGGLLPNEKELAAAEPGRALKLVAQSSGNRVHAEASSGGESAVAAAVAQPGSAPGFQVPEVVRSNRTSGPAKRKAA
jgi:transcriptional regulator with XRE-family HTH domain